MAASIIGAGRGYPPSPPFLQCRLWHSPRRALFHRLRPASRLGLCRSATAGAYVSGVVLRPVGRLVDRLSVGAGAGIVGHVVVTAEFARFTGGGRFAQWL